MNDDSFKTAGVTDAQANEEELKVVLNPKTMAEYHMRRLSLLIVSVRSKVIS